MPKASSSNWTLLISTKVFKLLSEMSLIDILFTRSFSLTDWHDFLITSSNNETAFLIEINDGNGQNEKLRVNSDGVLRFGSLDTLPTAVTGGLVYSSSNFYMGLD